MLKKARDEADDVVSAVESYSVTANNGFGDVATINLFDYLTVKFEGASLNARVSFDTLTYANSDAELVFYATDNSNRIKNGDVITVEFADSYLGACEMVARYNARGS